MKYQHLNNVKDKDIIDCINSAFADYAIPIHLTEDKLIEFFQESGIDRSISFAVYFQENIIGLILNSPCSINNEKNIFLAGTGVVPEHRKKGFFTNLYKFNEQELYKNKYQKYYLEVLQQNKNAINLYQKNGFTISREFSIMKCVNPIQISNNNDINLVSYSEFDYDTVKHCLLIKPSLEHSENVLRKYSNKYNVAIVEDKNKISAFCVFSLDNGNLIQLGYSSIYDLKKILIFLTNKYNNIIAKNIDTKYIELIEMLYSIGFIEIVKQYEMIKDIQKYHESKEQ